MAHTFAWPHRPLVRRPRTELMRIFRRPLQATFSLPHASSLRIPRSAVPELRSGRECRAEAFKPFTRPAVCFLIFIVLLPFRSLPLLSQQGPTIAVDVKMVT